MFAAVRPSASAGQDGVSPTLEIGNVTALASGAAATAAIRALGDGAYAVDLGIPAGLMGDPGLAGISPTLQLGNVTTLAAGAQATAGIRALGDGAYAVDLGIPTGAPAAAQEGGGLPALTGRQPGDLVRIAADGASIEWFTPPDVGF